MGYHGLVVEVTKEAMNLAISLTKSKEEKSLCAGLKRYLKWP